MKKLGLLAMLLAIASCAFGCAKTSGEAICEMYADCQEEYFSSEYGSDMDKCVKAADKAFNAAIEAAPSCEDKFRAMDECAVSAIQSASCSQMEDIRDIQDAAAVSLDCLVPIADYATCLLEAAFGGGILK